MSRRVTAAGLPRDIPGIGASEGRGAEAAPPPHAGPTPPLAAGATTEVSRIAGPSPHFACPSSSGMQLCPTKVGLKPPLAAGVTADLATAAGPSPHFAAPFVLSLHATPAAVVVLLLSRAPQAGLPLR